MKARHASGLAFAAVCGFLAGMSVMAVLVAIYRPLTVASPVFPTAEERRADPVVPPPGGVRPRVEVRPSIDDTAGVIPPASNDPSRGAAAAVTDDVVAELRQRRLEVPVLGVKRDELRNSFAEQRGGTRRHEAIDLLAPRNTPVVAVDDGVVARLFNSDAGGTTVYQFDPTTNYAYYYAHLERYADGLTEGAPVERGQVLGYVGTSGNAPKDTPHLHFAVFQLTSDKRWWQGTPIDPFLVLR